MREAARLRVCAGWAGEGEEDLLGFTPVGEEEAAMLGLCGDVWALCLCVEVGTSTGSW